MLSTVKNYASNLSLNEVFKWNEGNNLDTGSLLISLKIRVEIEIKHKLNKKNDD